MERLYLIRVDMQRFLGPFNHKQLKDSYARMEFGLQDEISGSLKQWVTFDDVDALRRHYPELAQMVQNEMLGAWGMNTQPQMQMPQKSRKKRRLNAASIYGLAVLGAILLFLLLREADLGMISAFFNRDSTFQTAQNLFSEENPTRFEAHMDRNRETIGKALKKKKGLSLWLPYVRAVAFSRDGHWEGLSSKKLRGKVEEPLPQDCSMAAWEETWKSSQKQQDRWSSYLDGRELVREDWAQILTIDPHWIRSRSPMPGWLRPGSYAEACMEMSLKALQRLGTASTAWEAKVFESRLRWQLGVITGKGMSEEFEMSGTLWALSCIEDSHNESSLSNCQSSLSVKANWKSRLDQATLKRRLLLVLEGQTTLDSESLNKFQSLLKDYLAKLEKERSSGGEELRYFQEIIQQNGDIRAAQAFLQAPNPKSEP